MNNCPYEIKVDIGPAEDYVLITDGVLTCWAGKRPVWNGKTGEPGFCYIYRDPGFTGPTREVKSERDDISK